MIIRSASRALILGTLMLLAGCSASIEGGGDSPSPSPSKPSVFDRAPISGPNVVGTWESACSSQSYGGSKIARMDFKTATDFKYIATTFSDRYCQTATGTVTHEGTYQFSEKFSETLYGIDYNYVEKNVTYKMNYQRLELASDRIFISELVFSGFDVNRDLPLVKTTSSGAKPSPAGCQMFSGDYQMNGHYFRLEQSDCTQITWVTQATYSEPESRTTYLTDGQPHNIDGRMMTCSFDAKGQLTIASVTSTGRSMLQVFSFQRRPCNLMNPDGADHLTRQIFYNGVEDTSSCDFWDHQ